MALPTINLNKPQIMVQVTNLSASGVELRGNPTPKVVFANVVMVHDNCEFPVVNDAICYKQGNEIPLYYLGTAYVLINDTDVLFKEPILS
jgi:hypothetical protein